MTTFLAMGLSTLVSIYNRYFSHKAIQVAKHITLDKSKYAGNNLLIVGDVHGCFDEFIELYSTAKKRSEKDLTVIMVGDMVNKGPKNIEVLDYLIQHNNIYCIRGNHEQWVMKTLQNPTEGKELTWIDELTEDHKKFLYHLPYSITIPKLQILIIHAGLVPGTPLSKQKDNDLLNVRCIKLIKDDFHGEVLAGSSKWDGTPWTKFWTGPTHIYFGHDAISKLQIHKHSTGLDTGCVYGGKLTGILLYLPDQIENNNISHESIKKELLTITPHKIYKPV